MGTNIIYMENCVHVFTKLKGTVHIVKADYSTNNVNENIYTYIYTVAQMNMKWGEAGMYK
jgi:hypothetical protein